MSKNSRKNKNTAMPTDPSPEPVVDTVDAAELIEQPVAVEEAIEAEVEVTAPAEDQEPEVAPEADIELTEPEADPEDSEPALDAAPAEAPPAEAPPVEPAPVEAVLPPVSAAPSAISKEVLRSVFNKRTVRYVDDAHWEKAVQAVKDGFAVTFIKRDPYLAISASKFDTTAKSVGVNSLNALIAGMV